MSKFVPPPANNFLKRPALICQDCELPVDPLKPGVRLMSKQKRKYRCNKCNSTVTTMSHACGGWPSEEFQTWDDETKVKFFRSGMCGNEIKKENARVLAKKHVESRIDQNAGEMRPLKYWVSLGYDEERLVKFTPECDKEYTDQAGQMYRVTVNTQIAKNSNRTRNGRGPA